MTRDSTMEILLLEIGDVGRGRVADMDLAGGVFAKVVSNPVLFGLALNLHLMLKVMLELLPMFPVMRLMASNLI